MLRDGVRQKPGLLALSFGGCQMSENRWLSFSQHRHKFFSFVTACPITYCEYVTRESLATMRRRLSCSLTYSQPPQGAAFKQRRRSLREPVGYVPPGSAGSTFCAKMNVAVPALSVPLR